MARFAMPKLIWDKEWTTHCRIDALGRVVIPQIIRRALKLAPRDHVVITVRRPAMDEQAEIEKREQDKIETGQAKIRAKIEAEKARIRVKMRAQILKEERDKLKAEEPKIRDEIRAKLLAEREAEIKGEVRRLQ